MLYSLKKLLAKLFGPNRGKNLGNTYHVFLRGGQVVELHNVTSFSLTRDTTTGHYSGYEIKFADGHVPYLCSFVIQDLIGVVSQDVQ